jgi:hypothetical protein
MVRLPRASPMKFDARKNRNPKQRRALIKWLVEEAASGLRRAKGDAESIRAVVFPYLHRAYEAGLEPDEIGDLLGVARGNVLNKARLSRRDEQEVLAAYEVLDPIVEATYQVG